MILSASSLTMLFCSVLFAVTVRAQMPCDSVKRDSTLFGKGVFFENKNVLIPWGSSFSHAVNMVNPKVESVKGRTRLVIWDTVMVAGIKMRVTWIAVRKFLSAKKFFRFYSIEAKLKVEEIGKVSIFFDEYCKSGLGRKINGIYWVIDGCDVALFEKYGAGRLLVSKRKRGKKCR
jgi:hypothetical protein